MCWLVGIVLDSQPLGGNVASWDEISSQLPNWNHDMPFTALDIFPIFLLVANTPQSWGLTWEGTRTSSLPLLLPLSLSPSTQPHCLLVTCWVLSTNNFWGHLTFRPLSFSCWCIKIILDHRNSLSLLCFWDLCSISKVASTEILG